MGDPLRTMSIADCGRVSSCFPLPTALLVHVLSYLQPSQRLRNAALVCKAWRHAANAATSSISGSYDWADEADQRQLGSIAAWHELGTAQQVTAIDLHCCCGDDDEGERGQLTLLSLDDLTECQLGWKYIPGPMGAAIAGLQQLQELDLHSLNVPEAEPHTLFKQLPVSITRLTVGRAHVTFTPFQTPGLSRLTALRDLLFTRVLGVEPSVLSGCASSLTRLTVRLAWTVSSLSALAHMLPQLQQLQSLCLTNELYGDDAAAEVAAPQVPAEACALLLSPAKLTSLTLREVGLAPGGAQRMFAAGGGALRELCIAGLDPDQQYSPPLTRSDLGSLALTWPQLQQLQLLTQLTGLTYLRVNDDISAEGWDGGALDAFKHDGGLVMWGAGPFPDVWRQLLTWCKRNTHCLDKMLEEQQQLVWLQAQQLQQQALQLQGSFGAHTVVKLRGCCNFQPGILAGLQPA
ncbi:hypothetical protein OEZ86_005214 [Tetradesmus obliquus]|nr:hypothetical protein OEZ86_005214 [Tetradesmus obliquus]